MTVGELIRALALFDPGLEVWADGDDREVPAHEPELREADDEVASRRVVV